jgi:hypothetical protein
MLLRTLWSRQKTQLLCNQSNPHSFYKTPGVWGTSATSPRTPRLLPRASKGALALLVDFLTLRFHNLTNPFSSNPFPFTSIQNPRGVGGCEPPLSPGDRNQKLGQTPNSTKICFPFNAVYRHSMHRNTVQRKVWSHKANSGRLDAETLGAPRSYFICGYICGLRAAHFNEQQLRVKNAGCDEDIAVESAKL